MGRIALWGVLVLLASGCTVDNLLSPGRPCSATEPCGPDAICDPVTSTCVSGSAAVDGAATHDSARDLGRDRAPARDKASVPDKASTPDKQVPPDQGEDITYEGATPLDKDGDKVPDATDNCPGKPNNDQKDGDKDKVGDVCDNCPNKSNTGQVDGDKDKVGDVCDNCPGKSNIGQVDSDADTVGDVCDNCPIKSNKDQKNLDGDSYGDLCDSDMDGDKVPNDIDPHPQQKDTVYYYETGAAASSDLVDHGTWTAKGTALCQTATGYISSFRARLLSSVLTAKDYSVQTRFSVNGTGTGPGYPSAGLILRATSVAPYSCKAYTCEVDLSNKRLAIGEYNTAWIEHKHSASGTLTGTSPYTLRASVKLNTITCEQVSGTSISYTDTSFTDGTPGFITYRVSACFDYLLVTAAP